jgi:UDP-N-acetylmuramoyl-tripeptide--D-alanyl-D-alanine ligase
MKLGLEQIADWTGAQLAIPHAKPATEAGGSAPTCVQAGGYSIDTRTLAPGDLFFAVRGERFDAHDFVAEAFRRGACSAIIASFSPRATPIRSCWSTIP